MLRNLKRLVNNHVLIQVACVLPIILLILYLSGCSPVPRHKTLSFFFDGVPDPSDSINSPQIRSDIKVVEPNSKPAPAIAAVDQNHYHPPYKSKQCGSCHDRNGMGRFVLPQPALCYQCHDDYGKKFKIVHGPVAGGYCTNCHNNHMSKNEKLLKRVSRDLCLICHNAGEILVTEAHKDIADQNCTDCHDPHGGRDHTLMK